MKNFKELEIHGNHADEEKKQINGKDSLDLTGDYSPRGSMSFRTDILFPDTPSTLPQIRIELPLTLSYSGIINLLSKISAKRGFEMTEQTPSAITVVFTPKNTIGKWLACCLFKEAQHKEVSIVRMLICLDEKQTKRLLVAKGMTGADKSITRLLQDVEKGIERYLATPENTESYKKIDYEEDEENTLTCKNETSSYYLFAKILSSESYTLGKSLSQFMDSFKSQYRNPQESALLLPQPIESIKLQVEETVDSLFSHYNYGRSSAEKIMVYCRPSVEKFIYSKLLSQLLDIYIVKYNHFEEKLQKMRQDSEGLTDIAIMEGIRIPKELRMEDEKEPYKEAIMMLNKIHNFSTPIERLNCLLSIVESIKTDVVDY